MKFKNIRSMAHNWTHSFMSGMNYVDGDYVFEDLHQLARQRRGEKVTITWVPEIPEELSLLTPRVRESIRYYRKALRMHFIKHDITPSAITEMRTEVYVAENHRMYVRAYTVDSRGKEHAQFVWA